MSFLRSIQRVIRSGFVNFWRNTFVTVASVFVMTIALFVLGSLLYLGAMMDTTLSQVENRVDVNVYFTTDAAENQILRLQSDLEARDDVEAVEYTSQEEALADFRRDNSSEDLVVQALEELESNPLGANLNIQATNPQRYEQIVSSIESNSTNQEIIDRINYYENQQAIDRLSGFIQSVDTFSFAIIVIFVIIAGLVVFNTIRLAIYSSKDEITVMELMGASRSYIRGPFVVEGVLYGIVSALLTLAIFYPLALLGADATERFFETVSSFGYYVNNFGELFVMLTIAGIILGGVSSYLAVRRYLDI
jgi:cell division transport system permease protein